ncbi:hypothetical protein ABK040_003805 [Willaertia magna]
MKRTHHTNSNASSYNDGNSSENKKSSFEKREDLNSEFKKPSLINNTIKKVKKNESFKFQIQQLNKNLENYILLKEKFILQNSLQNSKNIQQTLQQEEKIKNLENDLLKNLENFKENILLENEKFTIEFCKDENFTIFVNCFVKFFEFENFYENLFQFFLEILNLEENENFEIFLEKFIFNFIPIFINLNLENCNEEIIFNYFKILENILEFNKDEIISKFRNEFLNFLENLFKKYLKNLENFNFNLQLYFFEILFLFSTNLEIQNLFFNKKLILDFLLEFLFHLTNLENLNQEQNEIIENLFLIFNSILGNLNIKKLFIECEGLELLQKLINLKNINKISIFNILNIFLENLNNLENFNNNFNLFLKNYKKILFKYFLKTDVTLQKIIISIFYKLFKINDKILIKKFKKNEKYLNHFINIYYTLYKNVYIFEQTTNLEDFETEEEYELNKLDIGLESLQFMSFIINKITNKEILTKITQKLENVNISMEIVKQLDISNQIEESEEGDHTLEDNTNDM